MNLAVCLFKYFPYGGLQRDFRALVEECLRRGHNVQIYAGVWEGNIPQDFNVKILPVKGMTNHGRCQHFEDLLAKELQQQAYDLVIGFNKMHFLDIYFAADPCYEAKVRRLKSFLYRLSARYRYYSRAERAVFGPDATTKILLITSVQQQEFKTHYALRDERSFVLPPWLTSDRFPSGERDHLRHRIRQQLAIPDDHFLVLMIGSGFKTKGLDRALNAIASLSSDINEKVHFFVIGDDNPAPFLRLIKRLNIPLGTQDAGFLRRVFFARLNDKSAGNSYSIAKLLSFNLAKKNPSETRILSSEGYITCPVQFLGGRSDVPDFLAAADLLLHPAYSETAGIVLLEAVVAGLPVLTTETCGYACHVVLANAGQVIPEPFSQTALNKTLAAMLTAPEKLQWRNNGLQYGLQKRRDFFNMPQVAVDQIEAWAPRILRNLGFYHVFKLRADFCEHESAHHEFSAFSKIMALEGEVFRQMRDRKTLRFTHQGQRFFAKLHFGVGWAEIFKCLLQGKLPIIGARNEWQAIEKLTQLGVHTLTVAGFGCYGINPATQHSFLITEALENTESLETVCATWFHTPPTFAFKTWLIEELARISRCLHTNGLNHRDYYICHFLMRINGSVLPDDTKEMISSKVTLFLIDLHRTALRSKTPLRWVVKDMGGLYFSALDCGLTQRDLFRFMKIYRATSLRKTLAEDQPFWRKVEKTAKALYYKVHRCEPKDPRIVIGQGNGS